MNAVFTVRPLDGALVRRIAGAAQVRPPNKTWRIMITHIVVWKYRADVSQADREEHRTQLRSLRNIVPGIESLTVGFDFLRSPNSYDIGLLAHFADRSVLKAYTIHPEHVKVVEFGRRIAETMAKVDFED